MLKAVAQLLWPHKGREEWFSWRENHEKLRGFGLRQLGKLRIFAAPEFPVLSLEVQAQMPAADPQERTQFNLLVRHFLERFFNNELVTADGEAKTRLLQAVYAIALPGIVVALYLFPPYHAPGGRPFWSQISDHYFYVMYSFVTVGAVSIFAWDLFFPDLLDIFVLSSLPIAGRRLFLARIVAAGSFPGFVSVGRRCAWIHFPSDAIGPARSGAPHVCTSAGSSGKRRFCRSLLPEPAGSNCHRHG